MSKERDEKAETYLMLSKSIEDINVAETTAFKAGWDQALESEAVRKLVENMELVQEMIAVSKRKGWLDEDLALSYIREALADWEKARSKK